MNKQELINQLESCEEVIGIESIQGGDITHPDLVIKSYTANIFELVDGEALGISLYFYVQNEDSESEQAWFKRGSKPAYVGE